MADAPQFFVPFVAAAEQEAAYERMARRCRRSPAAVAERIYSITFTQNSEAWTAKVGETLEGVRRRITRSGGKRVPRESRVSDPATVLAIFAGTPFIVFTNKGQAGVRSAWENPFMAGQPRAVSFFAAS